MKRPTTSPLLDSKGTPPSRRRRISPHTIFTEISPPSGRRGAPKGGVVGLLRGNYAGY
jgi:hypothetical protein